MVSKAGHLDNMRLAEEDVPVPKPGEILVKVRSCGLNMADVFSILGLYSATPQVSILLMHCAFAVMFPGSHF
jgi:alcohol dehydrogenase